jgi:hypothetical protein
MMPALQASEILHPSFGLGTFSSVDHPGRDGGELDHGELLAKPAFVLVTRVFKQTVGNIGGQVEERDESFRRPNWYTFDADIVS